VYSPEDGGAVFQREIGGILIVRGKGGSSRRRGWSLSRWV
jgi:hypothetical protein